MAEKTKYSLRKILVFSVWLLLGTGSVVLLIAAITKKNHESVAQIEIKIDGVQNHYFIDKKDIIKIIEKVHGKKIDHAVISNLDLVAMERSLQKELWIKKAELFFDNNKVLRVSILEREPITRIFTTNGNSFYIDSSLMRLPLSDKFSARLPVFTNFPSDVKVFNRNDSALLRNIVKLSEFIINDPFWMAQIDQVDITSAQTFELIPKLGNQIIRFGTTEDYKEKFNKLFAFYKKVQTRTGWNKYAILDVQYKNQVIGISRDAKEIKLDSLRTIQIMKSIIADAQRRINDSTIIQLPQIDNDNSKINSSPIIDEMPSEVAPEVLKPVEKIVENKVTSPVITVTRPGVKTPVKAPVKANEKKPEVKEKPAVKTIAKPAETKTILKKETNNGAEDNIKKQPKAVMPPKVDQ